jgi:hypothetical protein
VGGVSSFSKGPLEDPFCKSLQGDFGILIKDFLFLLLLLLLLLLRDLMLIIRGKRKGIEVGLRWD